MNGFLCVDKSPGMTSRDAVNVVQRLIRPVKIGHAGTLDPMATGVLVMALGRATKLISHVQQMSKFYSAAFEFGKTSDTEDITGSVESIVVESPPELSDVEVTCQQFVGEILQQPPAYSALRVNGKRAHALARAGHKVELSARPIQIHSISVKAYEFPEVRLDVCCGSGTYIRSLGRDIGGRLGCGAVMTALRRTQIGHFHVERSVRVEDLSTSETVGQHLLPLTCGVDLPTLLLDQTQLGELRFGRSITCQRKEPELAALSDAKLAAILKRVGDDQYRPSINFVAQ